MGTTNQARYKINGVIDTARPVLQNIDNITNSLACWIAYDVTDGKWAVVINKAIASTFSFTDNNIIGPINVGGTGMDNLYNSVEATFPNNDLLDSSDFVRYELTTQSGTRKVNEPDLTLSLNYPLVNDPIQAGLLGVLEMKQGRVETTVTFTADYTATTVTGGDVVSITNTAHGFTNKLFRVLKTEELNNDGITIKITGMEYDATVYDNALTRKTYIPDDGIYTLGAIGKMTKPVAKRIGGYPLAEEVALGPPVAPESTIARQPHIKITSDVDSSVPAGLIEGIEVWIYKIPDTELEYPGTGTQWEADDDGLREYELHTVLRPDPGGSYNAGDSISYEIMENISPKTGYQGSGWANLLVKLRCVNSLTSGVYSPHTDLIKWFPRIMADGFPDDIKFPVNVPVVITSGYEVVNNLAASTSSSDWNVMYTSATFSPAVDAMCNIISVLDQNSSGARGGRGTLLAGITEVNDTVIVSFQCINLTGKRTTFSGAITATKGQTITQLNTGATATVLADGTATTQLWLSTIAGFDGVPTNTVSVNGVGAGVYITNMESDVPVMSPGSGGAGAFYWTDFACAGEANLYSNMDYKLEFSYLSFTASNPTAVASYDIAWTLNQSRAIE